MTDLKERIDHVLKEYGVDWKLEDKTDPDGPDAYYEALKDELIMVIKKDG